jgi:hypothetical protein
LSAINVSSVFALGASQRTKANEVNEKTNVNPALAIIPGVNIGA